MPTKIPAPSSSAVGTADGIIEAQSQQTLLKTGALQNAILNSANFSSIATDEKGVIQIFNVGAEHMLGYKTVDVLNKITPTDISDPQEVIARAKTLSKELETAIKPGFEALVFKASRGIEDIYELTYIRKDGSRFPAIVSVTALRNAQNAIIGYLLIGTDNTVRKQTEEQLRWAEESFRLMVESVTDYAIVMLDTKGRVMSWNTGAQRIKGYSAEEIIGQNFSRFYLRKDIESGKPQQDLRSQWLTALSNGKRRTDVRPLGSLYLLPWGRQRCDRNDAVRRIKLKVIRCVAYGAPVWSSMALAGSQSWSLGTRTK